MYGCLLIASILMAVVSADKFIGMLAKFMHGSRKGVQLSVHALSCVLTVTVKRLIPITLLGIATCCLIVV